MMNPVKPGQLARTFDDMAGALQERIHKQELAEKALLNHAMQQTVVAALGQFAITSRDFGALLDQAIMFVTQTLEVEYCQVLELSPDKQTLLLRAGLGWKQGCVGQATIKADPELHEGFALASGEPVVVRDFSKKVKFRPSPLWQKTRRGQWNFRRHRRAQPDVWRAGRLHHATA